MNQKNLPHVDPDGSTNPPGLDSPARKRYIEAPHVAYTHPDVAVVDRPGTPRDKCRTECELLLLYRHLPLWEPLPSGFSDCGADSPGNSYTDDAAKKGETIRFAVIMIFYIIMDVINIQVTNKLAFKQAVFQRYIYNTPAHCSIIAVQLPNCPNATLRLRSIPSNIVRGIQGNPAVCL